MPTLHEHLIKSADAVFDARAQRYAAINTPEKVAALQRQLRGIARDAFGEYTLSLANSDAPPRVLKSGQIEADGIVIEKFLYEAFKDFWVPALLYRPANAKRFGKCPALVMPVGHWFEGKSTEMYQQLMRLLARRGIICASFDGCGHGERGVWFSPVVRDAMQHLFKIHPKDAPVPYPLAEAPRHGFLASNNVTSAHCLIGDPGYLCGLHQHALTAVAGKRLLDLLSSRRDVEAQKIGACGASGGGADSRFLLSLDERVALAVPTSIVGRDRAHSGGDADQSFFFTVARGISQTDLLICLAPKPLLIISASSDKHDTAKVAAFYRPFWNAFGKGTQIQSATGKGDHGFPHESRKLIASFVLQYLRGETADIPDDEHRDDLPLFSELQLRTTFSGNVFVDGASRTPFELIRQRAERLAKTRPALPTDTLRARVLTTIGESEQTLARAPENVRSADNDLVWETEGTVPLRIVQTQPATLQALVVPETAGEGAASHALQSALNAAAVSFGIFETRGTGLSGSPGPEYNGAFYAPLLQGKQATLARLALHQGRTLLGMRAADLLQAASVLKTRGSQNVDLIAEGGMGLSALLAACLAPDAFRRILLFRTPVSWQELATGRDRAYSFAHYLYGVLEHFDTPDLTRTLPENKLLWLNPTDCGANVLPISVAKRIHRGAKIEFKLLRTESELARILQA